MAAIARKCVFDPCTVGIYHRWARLVGRALLCGVHPTRERTTAIARAGSWIGSGNWPRPWPWTFWITVGPVPRSGDRGTTGVVEPPVLTAADG